MNVFCVPEHCSGVFETVCVCECVLRFLTIAVAECQSVRISILNARLDLQVIKYGIYRVTQGYDFKRSQLVCIIINHTNNSVSCNL